MLASNSDLLHQISSAFDGLDSSLALPFIIYDDYMEFKVDQAVVIQLFTAVSSVQFQVEVAKQNGDTGAVQKELLALYGHMETLELEEAKTYGLISK